MERSNIYVDSKEFVKAIDDLTDALSRQPDNPKLLYKRGLAYYKNKEFKKAIRDLYESVEKNPFETYEADIHYHLGISYSNLEKPEMSIKPLSKAIELAHNEPAFIHERAKSYLLTGNLEDSLHDYDQVIQLQPKNSHAYFGRAFVHKAMKSYEDAAEDFQKAKDLNPFNPKLLINPKQIYSIKYIKLCEPGEEEH